MKKIIHLKQILLLPRMSTKNAVEVSLTHLNPDCISLISDYLDYYSTFALFLSCKEIMGTLNKYTESPYFYLPDHYTEVAIEAVKNNDLETIMYMYKNLYFRLRLATPLGNIYILAVDLERKEIVQYLQNKVRPYRRYYSMCMIPLKNSLLQGEAYLDDELKYIPK